MLRSILLLALLNAALCADSFLCPENEKTGKFPDPDQCDKYWECRQGDATPVICSDGLSFDPNRVTNTNQALYGEPCDFTFKVDCTGREQLQEPQGTLPCYRQNGYFEHEDPDVCDKYYVCQHNNPVPLGCSPGLHFNLDKRICDWRLAAQRGACDSKKSLGDFTCDPSKDYFTSAGQKLAHPTFPYDDDCAMFYVCKSGVTPALQKCSYGLVYSLESASCKLAAEVPECADYYNEELQETETSV